MWGNRSWDALPAAFLRSCIAVGIGALAAGPASAEAVADFYRGQSLSLVVGHEVGTGPDVYARVVARHLPRHMPGNPAIVVRNMIGASGMVAASWLYNIAPKDGTVIATFSSTATTDPLLGNAPARFEPAKFTWIGNIAENTTVCLMSKSSGIDGTDALLTRDTIFGVTAASGPFAKFTFAVKNLLGAKFKVVSGYKGSADLKIAINRGEVQGTCGLPFSTVTSTWREEYESGAIRVALQLNGRALPMLKGTAHIDDYARTPEDRQVFGLIFGVHALGRVYLAPPAVPVERRNALRAALTATAKDPQFLADAARTGIEIDSMSGEEVEAMIARIFASSPTVVDRAKAALRPD